MNEEFDANLNLLGRNARNGGMVPNGTSYDPPDTNCGVTNGTAIVGSYAPNSWGLYDMHGNVFELCLDWYEDNINAHGGAVNIAPAASAKTLSNASGSKRVQRGGAWNYAAGLCRPAYRYGGDPANRNSNLGFRVVCTAGLR